ncbi:MAG: hypothetical protein LQ340_005297 [Diploschistes diacapsis]|nr:MAG: hypothetical protein LQ340_005297 [Diploschistes diacapsis]
MRSMYRIALGWIREATVTLNHWLEDIVIDNKALLLDSDVASGGAGQVFAAVNKETQKIHVVKIVGETNPGFERQRGAKKEMKRMRKGTKAAYQAEPMHTRMTALLAEADRNLVAYNQAEIRNYIDIIRKPHPNVAALEGFASIPSIPGGEGYLLFLEYCDGGDLYSFVRQFQRRGLFFPEFFIWQVFESLLAAVAWLHKDNPDYQHDPDVASRPALIHGDINGPNVLLRFSPDNMIWPTAKLHDFDGAIPLWDDRETFELNFGKEGSDPPERPTKSMKGDVWGVGATIHYLAHCGYGPEVARPPPYASPLGSDRNGCQVWEFPPYLSQELQNVVCLALKMEMAERLGAGELLMYVREKMTALGMWEATRAVPEWLEMEVKKKLNGLDVVRTRKNGDEEVDSGSEEEEGQEHHHERQRNVSSQRSQDGNVGRADNTVPDAINPPAWGGSSSRAEAGEQANRPQGTSPRSNRADDPGSQGARSQRNAKFKENRPTGSQGQAQRLQSPKKRRAPASGDEDDDDAETARPRKTRRMLRVEVPKAAAELRRAPRRQAKEEAKQKIGKIAGRGRGGLGRP